MVYTPRLEDALACEPEPELDYVVQRWQGRLVYTPESEDALACEPDPELVYVG